jgi:type IV secretory pathway protease TraF
MLLILAAVMSVAMQSQPQPGGYVRGDLVQLVRAADDKPLPSVRVVAVAGDRIEANTSRLRVNGQPVGGVSVQLLEQFVEPWDQLVPADHYFVIAESRTVGERTDSTVRYFGLIPVEKIARKAGR